jgi:hypothetical protein
MGLAKICAVYRENKIGFFKFGSLRMQKFFGIKNSSHAIGI